MNKNHQITDGPLAPLIEAIKHSLRDELLETIRAEMRATAAEAKPDCIMLSIGDAVQRYGVGRINLKKLIAGGKLPAINRVCRGGHVGQFIHLGDAERVLGGRVDR